MSSEWRTSCSACGSSLCTRDAACPTCATCGKRGHVACTANLLRESASRKAGWWRTHTRAQLQVEFASLCYTNDDHDYNRGASGRPLCLNCSRELPSHKDACPLGDLVTTAEIALAIEEFERGKGV